MSVVKTTIEQLRSHADEGIVLTNCGGDLQEWLDGINNQFMAAGIFKNNSKFDSCYAFEDYGVTNLMFPTDGLDIDNEKLDSWVQGTYRRLGSTMLSEYYESESIDEAEAEEISPILGGG